jgi:RNA polymerase sigma factor (sigma-70 family)
MKNALKKLEVNKEVTKKRKGLLIKLDPSRSKSSAKRGLSDKARQEMVLEYREKGRSLAHSILRRWQSRLDPQEVDSIVDLSLCESVKRFDPKKGASFITFLFYHLRGNLIRAVSAAANLNFLPLPDLDTADHGEERGGVARGKVIDAVGISDELHHHDELTPDQELIKREVATISADACKRLDPLEREVIYRIFFLEQQLLDIANMLGYSRCHISRVKRKALQTLHGELAVKLYPDEEAPLADFESGEVVIESKQPIKRRSRSRRFQGTNQAV